MSRSSFASFHLTGIKPSSGKLMTSSVDRLFENDSDVFISSNYTDFNQALPSIQETVSVQSKSPEPNTTVTTVAGITAKAMQLAEQAGRESPSTTPSTAKSSRRDSLTDRVVMMPSQTQQPVIGGAPPPGHSGLPAHAPPAVPSQQYGASGSGAVQLPKTSAVGAVGTGEASAGNGLKSRYESMIMLRCSMNGCLYICLFQWGLGEQLIGGRRR